MAEFSEVPTALEKLQLLPPDLIAASVVGSVVRGWANAGSDLDIYMVTDKPFARPGMSALAVPLAPATVTAAVAHLEGRHCEIKYWTEGQARQLLTKLDREPDEAADVRADLTPREELFLERMIFCAPFAGEAWIHAFRGEIEAAGFREFLVHSSLGRANSALEDALGQMRAGDELSAVLSARAALGSCVDALLDSHGVYGRNTPKWRARRFREAEQEVLGFDTYWAAETMRDYDPAEPQQWIKNVVSLCRSIEMEIEI